MECKSASANPVSRAGFTLVELSFATGVGLMVTAGIALLAYYSTQSFAAMTNYTDMSQRAQLVLDKMSREIRQARQIRSYSTNRLTFFDINGGLVEFSYNSATRSLVRASGGVATTYLADCDSLQFQIFQHTAKSNSFDCYPPAYVTNGRVIQVNWRCTRPIRGSRANTDQMQSFKIALRNF